MGKRKQPVSFHAEVTQHFQFDQLVEAAVFAPRHRVAWKAHTADAMRNTLDDNATWVRRLMPILRGPHALDSIRNASNPKPRQPNTRWKYS